MGVSLCVVCVCWLYTCTCLCVHAGRHTCMHVLCIFLIQSMIILNRIELESEIRVQVDELMKEELKNLKIVSSTV